MAASDADVLQILCGWVLTLVIAAFLSAGITSFVLYAPSKLAARVPGCVPCLSEFCIRKLTRGPSNRGVRDLNVTFALLQGTAVWIGSKEVQVALDELARPMFEG